MRSAWPAKRLVDHIGKKLPHPLGHAELGTGENAIELRADIGFAGLGHRQGAGTIAVTIPRPLPFHGAAPRP